MATELVGKLRTDVIPRVGAAHKIALLSYYRQFTAKDRYQLPPPCQKSIDAIHDQVWQAVKVSDRQLLEFLGYSSWVVFLTYMTAAMS
jgi:hypothetical protein